MITPKLTLNYGSAYNNYGAMREGDDMKIAATLTTELRETQTRGEVRALRSAGKVPAIIYGAGKDPKKVTLRDNELTREYNKGGLRSKILELKTDKESIHVIARELQMHPVKDSIEHADFLYVDEKSAIRVSVPVHYLGRDKSPGIKRGGTLNIVRHDLELICTPANLPEYIEVDLSKAQIGDSIHISHVALPEGVSPSIADRDFTLATIVGRGGKQDAEDSAAEGATAEGEAAEGEKTEEKKDDKKE